MAIRPNFEDVVELAGDAMTVRGRTADEGPPPAHIHVFVEQNGQVQGGPVDQPGHAWQVALPATGFAAGPALAFGVEIHTLPFESATWTQAVRLA
jgi:hypothetical protein